MTNEQKAQQYGQLLNEHTRIGNQISEIKGQSIDLSQNEQSQIKELENRQIQIMNSIQRLLS
jgi:hypothetical protein